MSIRKTIVGVVIWVVCMSPLTASGAEMALVPVSASGPYAISGNEIILYGADQIVTLEIHVSDWGPARLKAYQVHLDSSGYASGGVGTLVPFGWGGPTTDIVCESDDDCSGGLVCWVPQDSELGLCARPGHDPESGTFIDDSLPGFVFHGLANMAAVDVSWFDYRYAAFVLAPLDAVEYVPPPKYCGTHILVVPPDAAGQFAVGFLEDGTFLHTPEYVNIFPALTSALITVMPAVCGNDICDSGEDAASCPEDCANRVDAIPTASAWGLAVMCLLLAVLAKLYFGHRRPAADRLRPQ